MPTCRTPIFILVLVLLAACTLSPAVTPTASPAPSLTFTPLPTDPAAVGPESTPEASSSYPSSISLEQAQTALAAPEIPVPSEIAGNPDVAEIVRQHTDRARQAGLNVDNPSAPDYVNMTIEMRSNGTNWYIRPEHPDGTLAGWMSLVDTSSASGRMYAQLPTWDNLLTEGYTVAGFDLPVLTDPANHFDTIDMSGFVVFVEVGPDGTPINYYSYTDKARISFESGTPVEEHQTPSWSLEIPATPEECTNVIPEASSGNMEEAVTSLNQQILRDAWFPNNVIPEISYSMDTHYNYIGFTTITAFWYDHHESDPFQLYSCSRYGGNYVFGGILYIPDGPTIPIQVLSDSEFRQIGKQNNGYTYTDETDNPARQTLDSYLSAGSLNNGVAMQLYYNDQFPEDLQHTATGQLLDYLDATYDYSNRMHDLMCHYGENLTRDQETLALLQIIVLPGNMGIYSQ
jgi:hypothetical protein